jgi:Cu+-exporting ATPase
MAMATDPVCGAEIDEKTAKHKINHNGKTFYFCCNCCKDDFKGNPTKYLGK